MAGSLQAHTAGGVQDAGDEASFYIAGTGTSNDGKRVPARTILDPRTMLPFAGSAQDLSAAGSLQAAQPVIGTPVAGGTVPLALGSGQSAWSAYLAGTFSGGTTVQFEGTIDGTNWFAVAVLQIGTLAPLPINSIAGGAAVACRGVCTDLASVRVRASALAGGDTVAVTLRASTGTGPARIDGIVAVAGDVASAAADSGNPLKVGGRYNAAKPTLTDGQRGDAQLGTSGQMLMETLITGDQTGWSLYKITNGSAFTKQALKASAGKLGGVWVYNNTGAAAFIQLFDAASGSVTPGTTVPDLQFAVATGVFLAPVFPALGINFATAITLFSATAVDGGTGSATGVHFYAFYK